MNELQKNTSDVWYRVNSSDTSDFDGYRSHYFKIRENWMIFSDVP